MYWYAELDPSFFVMPSFCRIACLNVFCDSVCLRLNIHFYLSSDFFELSALMADTALVFSLFMTGRTRWVLWKGGEAQGFHSEDEVRCRSGSWPLSNMSKVFLHNFYASAVNSMRRRHYVFRSSVRCPSVKHLFRLTRCSARISTKLATNIHHVSGHCWKGFQGQRSKVKVICVQMCECYNGGGIHFDSVALRLTCFEI